MRTWIVILLVACAPYSSGAKAPRKEAPAENLTAEQAKRAAEGMRIRAGASLSVIKYDDRLKLYEVQIVREPDVGPNYATVESFQDAVDDKNLVALMKKDPQSALGTHYTIKKNLWLIDPTEFPRRKAELSKKKKMSR